MVGCESRICSSISPAQRHPASDFEPALFAPSFRAFKIRLRVESAIACSARSSVPSADIVNYRYRENRWMSILEARIEFTPAGEAHSFAHRASSVWEFDVVRFLQRYYLKVAGSSLLLQNRAISVADQLGAHSLCILDVRERSQLHAKQLVRCRRRNECRIFFFLQGID
jgi:hypothetical protein